MRDIGDDYFEYSEKKFAIIGKKTKKEYRLGDHSKIKVKQVDLERKTIDYIFIEK
jgi:exoribonuclease R